MTGMPERRWPASLRLAYAACRWWSIRRRGKSQELITMAASAGQVCIGGMDQAAGASSVNWWRSGALKSPPGGVGNGASASGLMRNQQDPCSGDPDNGFSSGADDGFGFKRSPGLYLACFWSVCSEYQRRDIHFQQAFPTSTYQRLHR